MASVSQETNNRCIETDAISFQLPYAVVRFVDEVENDNEVVSEVPSIWISSDRTQCWWPISKQIHTLMVTQAVPKTNDSKWSLHKMIFEKYYDTLEKARKRALEMNESTDYSSNPENSKQKGRGQRNKTKNPKYLDGYESESKEDRNQNQNKTKNASKNRDDMYKNSNKNRNQSTNVDGHNSSSEDDENEDNNIPPPPTLTLEKNQNKQVIYDTDIINIINC